MDRLAQMGQTGIVYPVAKDIAPESDISVISLLGYDINKYYTGRGPLECFALGLAVNDGDLALRVNFSSVAQDGKTILDRRVGRNLDTDEAKALEREINSKITLSNGTFEFKSTVGHRGVLIIRGIRSKFSGWITNTDPAYGRKGILGVIEENFQDLVLDSHAMPGYEDFPEAKAAAEILNEFTSKSNKALNESAINKKRISEGKLPANIILSRDAGSSLPKFPPISEVFGFKFGCFVQMPVEKGIAMLTGMQIVDMPQEMGHLDVDYPIWAKLIAEYIEKFDVLYIHIKGSDEPGHDGNYNKKKEIIEKIDKYFFTNLIPKIDMKNIIIALTSDHATLCQKKRHSSLGVPLVISGAGIRPDGSLSFSEKAAKLGSIGEIKGQDILPLILKLAQ